jgi:thiamine transport system permease protein
VFSAFNTKLLPVITHATTIDAMINTVLVSLASALLSLGLAIGLLNSARHIRIRLKHEQTGQWLQLSGNVILVLPPLVLGTGLFLLLRPFADVFSIALVLVIIINSLMALPFILRILEGPVLMSANEQDRLLQSLGIQGFNRWRLIDWPTLRKPIGLSLAIAATLSAGDLTAIALFGSERIRTLPLLLYQRMGSYRLEEAAVTAGLLLVLCLALFSILQRLIGGRQHAHT